MTFKSVSIIAFLVMIFFAACRPEASTDAADAAAAKAAHQAEVAKANQAFESAVTQVTAKVLAVVVDPSTITGATAPAIGKLVVSETKTIDKIEGGIRTKGTITITKESDTKVTITVKLVSSWSNLAVSDGVQIMSYTTSGSETIEGTLTFEIDGTGASDAFSALLSSRGSVTTNGTEYPFEIAITAKQNASTNEMLLTGTVYGEPFNAALKLPSQVQYVYSDGRILACYDPRDGFEGCFEYTGSDYAAPFSAQCLGGTIGMARCPRDYVHKCQSPPESTSYVDYYYDGFDASKFAYLASICPGTWE